MTDHLMTRCPSCDATNRIPRVKVEAGLAPVCGRCKQRLPVDLSPVAVSDASFAAEVEQWPLPVVLDLWAPWCGPCRMMAPVLDALAADLAGKLRFAKLNVDENPATAGRYRPDGIPTLVLLRNGHEQGRLVGLLSKPEIMRRLQPLLD